MVSRIDNTVRGLVGEWMQSRESIVIRKQDMGEWEVEKARFYHQSGQTPAKSCFYDSSRSKGMVGTTRDGVLL